MSLETILNMIPTNGHKEDVAIVLLNLFMFTFFVYYNYCFKHCCATDGSHSNIGYKINTLVERSLLILLSNYVERKNIWNVQLDLRPIWKRMRKTGTLHFSIPRMYIRRYYFLTSICKNILGKATQVSTYDGNIWTSTS